MKPRFLLDENVPLAIEQQLLRLEPQILISHIGAEGQPPKGTLDPAILVWIEESSYILVTDNRSTMPTHMSDHLLRGKTFPGILLMRPEATIGQVVAELLLIWEASEAEEYYNTIKFVPLSPIKLLEANPDN